MPVNSISAFKTTSQMETTNAVKFALSSAGLYLDEDRTLLLPRRLSIASKVNGNGNDTFSVKLTESFDHDADSATPAQQASFWIGARGDFRSLTYTDLLENLELVYGSLYANIDGKFLVRRLHLGQSM